MLISQFESARQAAVPIIAIETLDQQGVISRLLPGINEFAALRWDILNGVAPLSNPAIPAISDLCEGMDPAIATGNPSEMLRKVINLPDKSVIFMFNAHRFVDNESVSTGIGNIRDVFKGTGSTLVLLGPSMRLPEELQQDTMVVSESLPDDQEVGRIIEGLCQDAEIPIPEDMTKIVDTLIGLSRFSAEQTLATCFFRNESGEIEIDRKALWERKCKAVEQTPGLSIWRGAETFDDIGGCENVKGLISQVIKGVDAPRAIVFMDEIEKAFAGSGSDSSGVSQDQLGAILSYMQDNEVDGMIFIGPPGAAKSAVAKAAGNAGNVPTVSFDLGGMKNALVGKSGEQTRQALKVISAISQGRALFIATCNSIGTLPPELRRRFTMGTFFFDLPTKEERNKIWSIYIQKYKITAGCIIDFDDGWTGAEIKQCCKLAYKLGIGLKDASSYIVPVAKSAAEVIENLRRQASGKFLDAGRAGIYSAQLPKTVPATKGRSFG